MNILCFQNLSSPKAINTLLVGLPVSLRYGSLGNVSVRVPWPNVLAAPFSVSVSGVSLTLVLRRTPTAQSTATPAVDLSSSVASLVAETFVHRDLSEDEGNALRQSIHAELPLESSVADAFSMPGSMDPFLDSALAASVDEPGALTDEEGVGVLTAVAERLMARFTCSARDISITLIHEGHTSFQVGVTEFSYGDGTSESNNITKSVSVRGFSLSTTILEPLDPSVASYSSLSPLGSPDRHNSGDEQQDSMMQSIASLADSSMFQSAVSTVHPGSASPTASTRPEPSHAQQIMSFSDEPISITIATRSRGPAAPNISSLPDARQRPPKFSINGAMGYVACALRPIDVGSILRALALIKPSPSATPDSAPPRQEPKKSMPTFEGAGRIRGIVVVLLLERLHSPTYSRAQLETELSGFFKHPTQSLSTPHFRARIDLIEPSFSASGDIRVNVSELSIFRMQGGHNALASPMLICDPNLDSQYSASTNVPVFDIVDWTKPASHAGPPKISAWRLRAIPGQKPKASGGPGLAIRMHMEKSGVIDVAILPLHVFLDLRLLEDAVSFAYGVGSIGPEMTSEEEEPEVDHSTPPSTPRFVRSVADDMEQAEKKVGWLV